MPCRRVRRELFCFVRSTSTHVTTGSRKVKRRPQVRQAGKNSDSEDGAQFSEDSLKSGTNSHGSSRPGSGSSRRRRRPTPRHGACEAQAKKRRAGSSGEGDYAATESDGSVYSEDSLTGGEKNVQRDLGASNAGRHDKSKNDVDVADGNALNKDDEREVSLPDQQDRDDLRGLSETSDRIHRELDGEHEAKNTGSPVDLIQIPSEATTDTNLDQCDSVTNLSEVELSYPSVPQSDENTDMSFRAHFGTIRKTPLPKTSNREREESETVERVTQSPITVWSGGSTSIEGNEDPNKPHLSMLGEQQPRSFQVSAKSANEIERLSLREPEVWCNSSFLPDVESTNSSTNTDVLERPVSKANRKRSHDGTSESETQQQKLRSLHSKYGLLEDDDEENLDDVRGEDFEEREEDGDDYRPSVSYQGNEVCEGTHSTTNVLSSFHSMHENILSHANNGDFPLAISVGEEHSSASSGVGMSSPEFRNAAPIQEHDLVDCGLVGSPSAEEGISNVTSPALTSTSGHNSMVSDGPEDYRTLESTQDSIFHSVDESMSMLLNNESSGTVDEYRTPLQSPKSIDALEEYTECSFSSTFSGALPFDSKGGQIGNAACKQRSLGPIINPDKVLVITDETVRQVLREEVERKLTRLERRIRSLSDSAISSDYCTDPDSCSVSPRCSRLRDLSIGSANLTPSVKSIDHGIVAYVNQKINSEEMDETIPYTLPSAAHRESSLRHPESTEYPYEAPVPESRQGRFPERLVNAILRIKEYPVFLSPSLKRLQRRRIKGRLTRSMDDLRDLEKKLESQKSESTLGEKAQSLRSRGPLSDFAMPKTVSKDADSLHTGLLQDTFHLSNPETVLHLMRQNTEARLDKQFQQIMTNQSNISQMSSDNAAINPANKAHGPMSDKDGTFVLGHRQGMPSESEISRLQAARLQLRSLEDNRSTYRRLDSEESYLSDFYSCQKRLAMFKSPSESDIPSQLEQLRDETRFQAKLAVLRSASVDYLACPDVEEVSYEETSDEVGEYHAASPLKSKGPRISDVRAPSSPRKFRQSFTSSLNSSIGFTSGHVSRSADSILTSNDSFDSPRYRGHGEAFPLLLDRSASLDDIYYQQLMKVQSKRQALNRSRSTGMVDAGNGAEQNEPDDQIFPPVLQDTVDGDEAQHEIDSFGDLDTELASSNLQDPAVISTVGFNYRKASHPRDFRGFNEEVRQQLEFMARHFAERKVSLPQDKLLSADNLSPRSESSEYSSDSYFKAAEVESGTPYFKEYNLKTKPIQSETGSQTEQESCSRSFDYSNKSWKEIEPVRKEGSILRSQGAESWQEVSKIVLETTSLLSQIRAQPTDFARLDLDSSGESFNTDTITGRSLSSRGDSPRKKLRSRAVADNVTAQESEASQSNADQLKVESSEDEERLRRNSQLADNITAVMHDLTSQEVKLPLELQQRILEEFLRTRHERELEEHQQQQLEQNGVSHAKQNRQDLRRSHSCGSYLAEEKKIQGASMTESCSTRLPFEENTGRYTLQYDRQMYETGREAGAIIRCADEEIMTDQTDVHDSSTQTTQPKTPEHPERVTIKVRDTTTQTGSSLNNSISEEVQTDLDLSVNCERSDGGEIHLRVKQSKEKNPFHASGEAERNYNPNTSNQHQSTVHEEIQTDLPLSDGMFQRPTIDVALSTDDLPHHDDLVLYSTEKLHLTGSSKENYPSQTDFVGDVNEKAQAANEGSTLQETSKTDLKHSESENQTSQKSDFQNDGAREATAALEDNLRVGVNKTFSVPVSVYGEGEQNQFVIKALQSTVNNDEAFPELETAVNEQPVNASNKIDLEHLKCLTSFTADKGMSSSIEDIRSAPASNTLSENDDSSCADNIPASREESKQESMKDKEIQGKDQKDIDTCLGASGAAAEVQRPPGEKSVKKKKKKKRKKKNRSGAKNGLEDETDSQLSESVTNEPSHFEMSKPEGGLIAVNKSTVPSTCITSGQVSDRFVETNATSSSEEIITTDVVQFSSLNDPRNVGLLQSKSPSTQPERYAKTEPDSSTHLNATREKQKDDIHNSGQAAQVQDGSRQDSSETASCKKDVKDLDEIRNVAPSPPLNDSNEEERKNSTEIESESVKEPTLYNPQLDRDANLKEMRPRALNESDSSEEEKTFPDVIFFPMAESQHDWTSTMQGNKSEPENEYTPNATYKNDESILLETQDQRRLEYGFEDESHQPEVTHEKNTIQRKETMSANEDESGFSNLSTSRDTQNSGSEEEREVTVTDVVKIRISDSAEKCITSDDDLNIGLERSTGSKEQLLVTDVISISERSIPVNKSVSGGLQLGIKAEYASSSVDKKSDSEEEKVMSNVIPIPLSTSILTRLVSQEEKHNLSKPEEKTSSVDRRSSSEEEIVVTDMTTTQRNSRALTIPVSKEQRTSTHETKLPHTTDMKSDSEEEIVVTDIIPIPSVSETVTRHVSNRQEFDFKQETKTGVYSECDQESVATDVLPTPISPSLPTRADYKDQKNDCKHDERTASVERRSDSQEEEKAACTGEKSTPSNSSPISKTAPKVSQFGQDASSSVDKKSDSEEEVLVTDVVSIPTTMPISQKQNIFSAKPSSSVDRKSDSEEEVLVTDVISIPVSQEKTLYSAPNAKISSSVDKKSDSEEEVLVTDVISIPTTMPISQEQTLYSAPNTKPSSSVHKKSDSEEEVVVTDVISIPTTMPISQEQTLYSASDAKLSSSVDKKSDSEEEVVVTDVISIPTQMPVSQEQTLYSAPNTKHQAVYIRKVTKRRLL
ncbi:hypothetical protein EGW08_005676 [Elysia chlorotica]|uniref:Uncharacterized protein n=1 Tax=Elysia chlorotica TaxID=188477 RepID=A0A3S1C9E4_ELYCH|nr:hypothetical protein EGW08_005676 [Elysia chlorotica]